MSLNDLCISSVVRPIITYQISSKGYVTRCSSLNLVVKLLGCVTLPFIVAFPVLLNACKKAAMLDVVHCPSKYQVI